RCSLTSAPTTFLRSLRWSSRCQPTGRWKGGRSSVSRNNPAVRHLPTGWRTSQRIVITASQSYRRDGVRVPDIQEIGVGIGDIRTIDLDPERRIDVPGVRAGSLPTHIPALNPVGSNGGGPLNGAVDKIPGSILGKQRHVLVKITVVRQMGQPRDQISDL